MHRKKINVNLLTENLLKQIRWQKAHTTLYKKKTKLNEMRSVQRPTYVGGRYRSPGENRYKDNDQLSNNYADVASARRRHHNVVRYEDSRPHPVVTNGRRLLQ